MKTAIATIIGALLLVTGLYINEREIRLKGGYKVIISKEDGINTCYSVTMPLGYGYDFINCEQLDTVLNGGELAK